MMVALKKEKGTVSLIGGPKLPGSMPLSGRSYLMDTFKIGCHPLLDNIPTRISK